MRSTRPGSFHDDPVRRRRAQVARMVTLAKKIGYASTLASIATFFLGLATGFSPLVASVTIVLLVVSSVVLAPAIILGFAVLSAERHDVVAERERE